ncbi:MAG: 50S ribosomal protein L9 [Candidatus Paceibacterota bacterium]|jgi:large subunit ribosomal protein L9
MKIVLLKDVQNVGKKWDVKEVSDGHAVNFLIPQGLAEDGTAKAVKRAELNREKIEGENKIRKDLLLKNLGDLDGVSIEMYGKANEKGHLFAAIHKPEIVPAIKAQTGLDVDPNFIVLEEHLKTVGEHEIEVKAEGKSVKFKLIIKSDEEPKKDKKVSKKKEETKK